MPVVQQLTLQRDIVDVPKGTTILIVTPSRESKSTSGVARALRRAGFTDDQFDKTVNEASNWQFQVMSEMDPGELNLQLAKFSEPIYGDPSSTSTSSNLANTVHTNTSTNSNDFFTGDYWEFWENTLGNFIYLLFPIPLVLWLPYLIIKSLWWLLKVPFYILLYLLKGAFWVLRGILYIVTFGMIDDIFDNK